MRDVGRLGRILWEFGKIWSEHPDMRMGQLYLNLVGHRWDDNAWNCEDDELEAGIFEYKSTGRFRSQGAG